MRSDYFIFTFILLLLLGGYAMCTRVTNDIKPPLWVTQSTPIKAGDIPQSDYPYLAHWLDHHAKPAQDYVISLFKRHDLVILGEFHNIKEHKDFLINLIPQLYHRAGVRCIAWEFSRQSDNDQLDKLVTAKEFDHAAALDFARNQSAHEWDSKEHWDIIEAVWRLNKSLKPGQPRMRLIGIFPNVDLCEFYITMATKSQDSPEFQKTVLPFIKEMDALYAQPIEQEILAKKSKGLAFVGRCHDFTHYEFPPEMNLGRPIMGNLLYKKYGERVFQVWLDSDFLHPIEQVLTLKAHQQVGFDLYASPFANILSPLKWDAPGVPLSKIARGYISFGPKSSLHKNTPIKGFVTDQMFEKYRRYYELDFKRTFANAEEINQYFAEHRFPRP